MTAAIGPGMRVKCVREGTRWEQPAPKLGNVSTVLRVLPAGHRHIVRGSIYLLGHDFLILEHWEQQGYAAPNFVPLDGNEDLSVLTGLLDKVPGRVKEPA